MRRAASRTPPPAERLAFLEGIRGVLALYVVVSHIFTMIDPSAVTGRPSVASPWLRNLAAPFLYGHVAVAMFIVVSGFALQLGLLQGGGVGEVRSLSAFFRRRALRILPAYYAALLVSLIVALNITPRFTYPPFTTYLPVDVGSVVSHLLLVQNFRPEWLYKINGVMWTISIEVQLYVIFPGLARILAKRGRGVLLLTGLLLWLLFQGLLGLMFPAVYLRLWYAFLFAIGMGAAHLAYRPPLRGFRTERWTRGFAVVGLAVGVAALLTQKAYALSDIPLGIALASLCALGTVGGGGWLIRSMGSGALGALGAFSYSLYLMHHPILQLVYASRPSQLAGEGSMLAWLTLVGLPLMLGVAWLFSLAFERLFLRRRTKTPRTSRRVPGSLPLGGVSVGTPLPSGGEGQG